LKHDEESTELKWFKYNEIPNEILSTQMNYIKDFIAKNTK